MKGCENCKHWNGTRASTWGDCQHVIFDMIPMKYEDRFGDECKAPLDPHDLQYYLSTSGMHMQLKYLPMCHGIRHQKRRENVMWMDDSGEQTVKAKDIMYTQTHREFVCGRYTNE